MQTLDKNAKTIQINNAQDLKTKLKCFPLTRDEQETIKTLRSDITIVVQKNY